MITWLQRPTRRCQTKLLPIQWACPKVNGHRLSLKLLPSLRVSRSSIGWKKRLLCLQLWTRSDVEVEDINPIQIWASTSRSTTSAKLSFPLPPGCLNKALSSNRAASVTWFGSPMLQPSWTVISGLVNAGTQGGISGGFDTGPSSTLDKGENLGTMDFFLLPHSWLLDSRSHGHRTGPGDCGLWSRQVEGPWGQGGFQLSESPWALPGPMNLRWETSPVGKRSLRRHGSTDSLSPSCRSPCGLRTLSCDNTWFLIPEFPAGRCRSSRRAEGFCFFFLEVFSDTMWYHVPPTWKP